MAWESGCAVFMLSFQAGLLPGDKFVSSQA